MISGGLLTLERAALPGPGSGGIGALLDGSEPGRLTVYCGRGERWAGRPAPVAAVAALRAVGLPGAIVLTGLDGTIGGERRRARVLSRNAGVPALVQCVGPASALAAALPRLGALAGRHVATLERVRILRRDGARIAAAPRVPHRDPAGMGLWQRVTVTCGEDARLDGRPLHVELIRRLRAAGASGATALRGSWGYSGEGPLHHDRLLALRRRTPVVVSVVERPDEMARLWPIVDGATARTGLVACELLPAARARSHDGPAVGGLRLAAPPG
jgi:PII-like signaling protein